MSAATSEKPARKKYVRPYSRPEMLARLDLRSREARLLRKVRADLTAHVGGKPSATQKALIERCALLTLHTALLDAKVLEGAPGRVLSERDGRQYLAWSNSLDRSLRQLGLKGAAAAPRTLADHIAERGAA